MFTSLPRQLLQDTPGAQVDTTGGKYWLSDKPGEKAGECPPQSCEFREGLAPAEIRDKWGYIDKTGKYVWRPTK